MDKRQFGNSILRILPDVRNISTSQNMNYFKVAWGFLQMKLKDRKTFRLLIQPFLFTVLICLPWWLLANFIVKTDLASSAYAIAIFVIMWLTMFASAIVREKPEKEREQISWNIASGYFGKVMPVYFGISLLLLLMILIAAVFKK